MLPGLHSRLAPGKRVTALIFAAITFLGQLSPTVLPFLDQPSPKILLLLLSVHIVAPWESISFPLIHQDNTFCSELSGPKEWQNTGGGGVSMYSFAKWDKGRVFPLSFSGLV